MTDRAGSFDPPPHGTLAQEAAKLVEVAQQWLAERAERVVGEPMTDAPAAGAIPDCLNCPICRARRLLAELNPEVFAHLADAATSMTAAMKAMATDDERSETS